MGRRAPRPVSAALGAILDHVAPQTPLAAVQVAWPRAAGEAIAAEAEPVAEREGTVTIACSSSTWAEQLDLLQDDLLRRLQAELGGTEAVQELRFQATDPGFRDSAGAG